MKKTFFTAIALIAFSITSMANTIEVKEKVNPVEEKEEVVIKRTICDVIWIQAYTLYLHAFGSHGGIDYADAILATADIEGC